MTATGPCWRIAAFAGLVVLGLVAGVAGQTRDDFANACAPLISLSTMTPPPGETGNVVRRLQTIAAGIAKSNADLIVSAYSERARIENFPMFLGERGSRAVPDQGAHPVIGKDGLRRVYRAYFENFPNAAVVFTRVNVSVEGTHAAASARARFVLPPGSGRDTYTATVTWKLARQADGWTIADERYQE